MAAQNSTTRPSTGSPGKQYFGQMIALSKSTDPKSWTLTASQRSDCQEKFCSVKTKLPPWEKCHRAWETLRWFVPTQGFLAPRPSRIFAGTLKMHQSKSRYLIVLNPMFDTKTLIKASNLPAHLEPSKPWPENDAYEEPAVRRLSARSPRFCTDLIPDLRERGENQHDN